VFGNNIINDFVERTVFSTEARTDSLFDQHHNEQFKKIRVTYGDIIWEGIGSKVKSETSYIVAQRPAVELGRILIVEGTDNC